MKKYRGFQNEVSLGSWAPSSAYTSTIKPTSYGYYPLRQPLSPPAPVGIAPLQTVIPYVDLSTRYTREQILDMIEDRKAAEAAEHELTYSQNSEGGDGIDEELEQFANEQAATDQTVRDGAGLPTRIGAPEIGTNVVPLAILGLLAYLFF